MISTPSHTQRRARNPKFAWGVCFGAPCVLWTPRRRVNKYHSITNSVYLFSTCFISVSSLRLPLGKLEVVYSWVGIQQNKLSRFLWNRGFCRPFSLKTVSTRRYSYPCRVLIYSFFRIFSTQKIICVVLQIYRDTVLYFSIFFASLTSNHDNELSYTRESN